MFKHLGGAIALMSYAALTAGAAAQVPAEVENCRLYALEKLKDRSPTLEHLTFDIESLAISKAETKVEDTPVKMIIMGDAYLQREKTDKPTRFVCLVGENRKVLLTFFTEQ